MNQNSKHINLIIKLIKLRDNAIVLPWFFNGWVVVPLVVTASKQSIKLGQVVCQKKKIVERLVEMRGRWFWCFWRLEVVFVVVSWFLGFFFFNERGPQRTYECFLNFFSIGLTRSHNLNHEFCRLARINLSLIT